MSALRSDVGAEVWFAIIASNQEMDGSFQEMTSSIDCALFVALTTAALLGQADA
jgi:hypothetical protein